MTTKIKQGDTHNPLVVVLYRDGVVVDLTDAEAVYFYMRPKYGGTSVGGSAAFDDREGGQVSYAWTASDLEVAGNHEGEFEVMWSGDKPETFPNGTYIEIEVLPDLGAGGTPA